MKRRKKRKDSGRGFRMKVTHLLWIAIIIFIMVIALVVKNTVEMKTTKEFCKEKGYTHYSIEGIANCHKIENGEIKYYYISEGERGRK